MTNRVGIKWDDLSEVKFGEIANMISAESKDDAHGYHEDINGEGVTLVDGERMSNLIGTIVMTYPSMVMERQVVFWRDTDFSGSLAILNENDFERT